MRRGWGDGGEGGEGGREDLSAGLASLPGRVLEFSVALLESFACLAQCLLVCGVAFGIWVHLLALTPKLSPSSHQP